MELDSKQYCRSHQNIAFSSEKKYTMYTMKGTLINLLAGKKNHNEERGLIMKRCLFRHFLYAEILYN